MDRNGEHAARGKVDEAALATLLADRWFALPFPKSLDRDAFSFAAVAGLTTEDGAATLTAFTAQSIAAGIALAGGGERIVIAGGGSHNPRLLAMIAEAVARPVVTADATRLVRRFSRGGGVCLSGGTQRRRVAAELPGDDGRSAADAGRGDCTAVRCLAIDGGTSPCGSRPGTITAAAPPYSFGWMGRP